MIDLDPSCLRAFISVIDSGGFTRAGARLNRTQSAISMQVRRLEEMLGTKLFEDRKKATLTPAGERILEHARRMLALNDELVGRAKGADIAGRVRLGTPDDYVSFFLPTILRRLSITHPQVEVEVRCNMTADLMPAVDRGVIDLALITRASGADEGTPLRREPLIWAAADETIAKRRPLPLALFSPGCRFREATLAQLDAAHIPYRIAYESPSVASISAAVCEGLAISALARLSLLPSMKVLDASHGLPILPDIEIALYGPRGIASPAAMAVRASLLETLSSNRPERAAA
ncbi:MULTISPECIES: LysR substrate-binding domain-containing protein [Rhodomicrobium]|uniref:LysR substrate-binding domain-containing protein n=1 Tax=Rhodomicrobium TaxID=1068 RepID=UPI000B4B4E90|nr:MULTISPECIES: LysR substrate-binding domain-containing protein [Rhodomicrobium]